MHSISCFTTIFTLLLLSLANAQTNDAWFKAMQSAFEGADFEEAIHHGKQLLQKDDIPGLQREEVYRTLGVSYFHRTSLDSSRYYFIRLLSLKQSAALDPIKTSPKIIQYFEGIRQEYIEIRRLEIQTERPEKPATQAAPVKLNDIRPSAGLSSLLIPGLGQWKKGHKARSVISAVGFISLLGTTAITWNSESDARDAYLNAKTFPEINNLYDEYNTLQKRRKSLLVATGIIWGLSVVDAFWSPYAIPEVESDQYGNFKAGIRMRF